MSVPDFLQRPWDFIAPSFLSAFIQAVESGIILSQHFNYWSRCKNPGKLNPGILIFITVVGLVQTAVAIEDLWRVTVRGFGNWEGVFFAPWSLKIQSLFTALMGIPVQCYLTWRVWTLSMHRIYVLSIFGPMLVTYLAAVIVVTVRCFKANVNFTQSLASGSLGLEPSLIISLIIPAVLDIFLTGILSYQLACSRSQIIAPEFRKMVGYLMLVTWEAGVPPCACAIAAAVVYITCGSTSYWDVAFLNSLGKLYVISYLTTLNAKSYLADLGRQSNNWRQNRPSRPPVGDSQTPCECQCQCVTRQDPKDRPLEFATLSQTSETIELDSILGPIDFGFEPSDFGSSKTRRTSGGSWRPRPSGGSKSFDVWRDLEAEKAKRSYSSDRI